MRHGGPRLSCPAATKTTTSATATSRAMLLMAIPTTAIFRQRPQAGLASAKAPNARPTTATAEPPTTPNGSGITARSQSPRTIKRIDPRRAAQRPLVFTRVQRSSVFPRAWASARWIRNASSQNTLRRSRCAVVRRRSVQRVSRSSSRRANGAAPGSRYLLPGARSIVSVSAEQLEVIPHPDL